MGFLNTVKAAFVSLSTNLRSATSNANPYPKVGESVSKTFDTKKAMTYQLQRRYFYHVKAEVENWRKATTSARNILLPRRYDLLRLFDEVMMTDDELPVAYRNAHVDVQAAPFLVLKNGKELKDRKHYFDKSWFQDFLTLALDEEFYGYSVFEFEPIKTGQSEFEKIITFPREHYRPETGEILKYIHDTEGVLLTDLQAIGVKAFALGGKHNMGILEQVSLSCIRKSYTITDWSIRNEKFGMPFVWLTTDLRREDELRKREQMLSTFGANGWGIGSDSEKLEFHEPASQGNGHLSFLEFLKRADTQIDKLINGQSSTTSDKAYVGAAQVHERVMGQFTKSRLRRIQNFINDILIPFLITQGYNLKGCVFQFTEIWDENPKKQIQADPTTNPENDPNTPKPNGNGQKKKLSSAFDFSHTYNNVCCQNIDGVTHSHPVNGRVELSTNLNALFEQALKNVFTKKIKAGQLDPSVWQYNVAELWKGVESGFGTSYGEQDKAVIAELKRNVHVFAAFKNHANVQDVAALLVNEAGEQRPYAEFKELALQVSENYNQNWLRSEYQLAERSATMAVEWQRIQADKDIFPNLKYVTAGDEKVRLAHAKLDGLVLPIDDPFWDAFYPPNGWGCRCTVEQTDAAIKEPDYIPDEKQVPMAHRVNTGKDNAVFSKDHPYFVEQADSRKSILKQLKKMEKNAK